MAALLLGAIGLSAQKIREKRDERKRVRALDRWEEERVEEFRRKAALETADGERDGYGRRNRKSEEVGEERQGMNGRGVGGEGRRSESVNREGDGEAPPPRYEDVVAEGLGAEDKRTRGGGSMLNV